MKPISFKPNDEMIRAILNGEKTVTRRAVKPQPEGAYAVYDMDMDQKCVEFACGNRGAGGVLGDYGVQVKAPYWFGDILYVRETWAEGYDGGYIYKADDKLADLPSFQSSTKMIYRPSIHMPRKAARIFLRVTDVRAEKLQEINERGPLSAKSEGFVNDIDIDAGTGKSAAAHFAKLWDSAVKPADRALYGWDANPWVWAIEFERIGREEAKA